MSLIVLCYLLFGLLAKLSVGAPQDDTPSNLPVAKPIQRFSFKVDRWSGPVPTVSLNQGALVEIVLVATHHVNDARCSINQKNYTSKADKRNAHTYTLNWTAEKKLHNGSWSCVVKTLKNVDNTNGTVNTYHEQVVFFNVKIRDPAEENKVINPGSIFTDPSKEKWIYIPVGIVVVLIIAVQTGVILYFKAKARKMARIRRISQRASTYDNEDKKRYIMASSGQQRSKLSAWLAKKRNNADEDIYETLEEMRDGLGDSTPPVPPIENIPTLKTQMPNEGSLRKPDKMLTDTSSLRSRATTPDISSLKRQRAEHQKQIDISKRPPLPIPVEAESAETSRSVSPVNPSHEFQSKLSNKLKPGQVSMSIVNELDNKFMLRKASLTAAKVRDQKSASRGVSFLRNIASKTDSIHMPNFPANAKKFQLPENPSPMPSGKSAVLLGLKPAPKPLKTRASVFEKAGSPPPLPLQKFNTSPHPPKAEPTTNTPTLAKHVPTPPKPMLAKPTNPVLSNLTLPKRAQPNLEQTNPTPTNLTLPKRAPANPAPTSPLPSNLTLTKRAPTNPQSTKPPVLPVVPEPSVLNEIPGPKMLRPIPKPGQPVDRPVLPPPVGPVGPKPSLPSKPPVQEPVYEEHDDQIYEPTDEPLYNSDEEWTYEPLDKYNIYST